MQRYKAERRKEEEELKLAKNGKRLSSGSGRKRSWRWLRPDGAATPPSNKKVREEKEQAARRKQEEAERQKREALQEAQKQLRCRGNRKVER